MKQHPVRVGKNNLCPVCQRDTWCLVGTRYVVCMRVQSGQPKQLAGGEVGWLHPIGADYAPPVMERERPAPLLNVSETLTEWAAMRWSQSISTLSSELGVTNIALEQLGCVRAPYHETWAFPMRTGDNSVCGIRLRNIEGKKWAERGSHAGLFIPQGGQQDTPLIVEGPTDCAAALTIGYYAIGRPSCSGGVDHLKELVKRSRFKRAVIVSDLDDAGLRGAKTLCEHLPIPTAILVCPAKDMRAFVNNGGDRIMLDAMIDQLVWHT